MIVKRQTIALSYAEAERAAGRIAARYGIDSKPDIRPMDDDDDEFRVHYEVDEEPPVCITKRKDAATGQVWSVKVSGARVPVRLTRVGHRPSYGGLGKSRQRPWFWGTNTKTGRDIEGNRMRLRTRLS